MKLEENDRDTGTRRFPHARTMTVLVVLSMMAVVLTSALQDPGPAGAVSAVAENGSVVSGAASPASETSLQPSPAESPGVGTPEPMPPASTAPPEISLDGFSTDGGEVVEDGGSYATSSFTIDVSLCAQGFSEASESAAVFLMDGQTESEKLTPAWFVWQQGRWCCTLQRNFAEGGHELRIVVIDDGGQRAETTPVGFTVDTHAPTIALTPDSEYTNGDVVVSLSADDVALRSVEVEAVCRYGGVDKVTRCVLDGDEGHDGQLTFDATGTTSVTATAVDGAGNRGNASTSFTIDRQPPLIDDVTISSQPVRLLERDEEGAIEWFFDSGLQLTLQAHDMSDTLTEGYMRGIVCDGDLTCCLCNATVDGSSGSLIVSMADGAAFTGAARIEVSDRAGNTATWQMPAHGLHVLGSVEMVYPDALIVDTTAPRITLEGVDEGGYHREGRTVTLVLDEHNLPSLQHEFPLRSAYGEEALSVTRDGEPYATLAIRDLDVSGDATSGRGSITLETDGLYRIQAHCTDPAGNGAQVSIGDVVIDTTPPVLEVSFDNDDARNGHYYKHERTATISFTERWFDSSLVDIETTGMVGSWDGEGERHVLQVAFAQDGAFRLRCAGSDIAGNGAGTYDSDTFIIDRNAPAVTIEGVADHASYTGDPVPTVTLHDENHDASADTVTLTGGVRGTLSVSVEQSDPLTASCHVPGFPRTRECDDIYTLHASAIDLAGNETLQELVFSLNRFGSAYRILPESEAYLEGFDGTGHRSYGDAVMVEEVNVDELVEHSVFVSRDGTVERLAESGTGGVPSVRNAQDSGCAFTEMHDGSWHRYLYTIAAGTFLAEGAYRIMLHSTDAAGNVSENTLASNDADIALIIDRTRPVVRMWGVQSGECYIGDSHEVYISAFDNLRLESLDVKLDGTVLHPQKASDDMVLKIPADPDGEHDLQVSARDAAGNVSEVVEATGFKVVPEKDPGAFPKRLVVGGILVMLVVCGVLVFRRSHPSG